MILLKTLYTKR